MPVQRIEQTKSRPDQRVVEWDAFAVHTHAADRRLLPQSTVGEHSDRPSTPTQGEEPLADTFDPPLQQNRERRDGKRAQPTTGRGGVGHRCHSDLAPCSLDGDHRAVRLDDSREERGVRQRVIALISRRDDTGLWNIEAARPGELEHVRLVGAGPVGREVAKRDDDCLRQGRSVLEHRFD